MATTTTTTVSAVQAAFVTAAKLEVPSGVTVHRVWPGADATRRMVFFTDVDWTLTDDALIKAGRRFRNEEYSANFEIWSFPEDGPADGASAIDDALAIYNACEEVVAKDASTVRSVAGLINATCQPIRLEPVTVEKAWAIVLTARLSVSARLS